MENSVEVSNIIKNLTVHQEDELYNRLKERRYMNYPRKYPTLDEKLSELSNKYFDFVWYARKFPEDRENIPAVDTHMTRIEKQYPKEIQDYDNNPDWTHGFNSGALAIVRLIHSYALDLDWNDSVPDDEDGEYVMTRDTEIEMAEEMFPMLDT